MYNDVKDSISSKLYYLCRLTPEQRIPDELSALGELAKVTFFRFGDLQVHSHKNGGYQFNAYRSYSFED